MYVAKTNVKTADDLVKFSDDNDSYNSITSRFDSTCSNPVICMYRLKASIF